MSIKDELLNAGYECVDTDLSDQEFDDWLNQVEKEYQEKWKKEIREMKIKKIKDKL